MVDPAKRPSDAVAFPLEALVTEAGATADRLFHRKPEVRRKQRTRRRRIADPHLSGQKDVVALCFQLPDEAAAQRQRPLAHLLRHRRLDRDITAPMLEAAIVDAICTERCRCRHWPGRSGNL